MSRSADNRRRTREMWAQVVDAVMDSDPIRMSGSEAGSAAPLVGPWRKLGSSSKTSLTGKRTDSFSSRRTTVPNVAEHEDDSSIGSRHDVVLEEEEEEEAWEGRGVFLESADEEEQTIRLNVGGTLFVTSNKVLQRYPNTLLGNMEKLASHYNRHTDEYFFARNPYIFAAVLDLYRTQELHLPRNFCGNSALRELEFWEIPPIWVSACCWSSLHGAIQDRRLYQDLRTAQDTHEHIGLTSFGTRPRIWKLLNGPMWSTLIHLGILLTLVLFYVDAHPDYREPRDLPENYTSYLASIGITNPVIIGIVLTRTYDCILLVDIGLLIVLIVEVVLKMVCCPKLTRFLTPCTVMYSLSLLVCAGAHIAAMHLEKDYRNHAQKAAIVYIVLQLVHFQRMMRIFELVGRHPALRVMWIATQRNVSELLLLVIVFLVLATLFGSTAYYFEISKHSSQCQDGPSKFAKTMEGAFYWAIITMTTVGYGDITPCTNGGRMVGTLCAITGVIVLAMPVAVLTLSFNEYFWRQEIHSEKLKSQKIYFRLADEEDEDEESLDGVPRNSVARRASMALGRPGRVTLM